MAQSTLTNFFPTVKRPPNFLSQSKEKPGNTSEKHIVSSLFFETKLTTKPIDSPRKSRIDEFFPKKIYKTTENTLINSKNSMDIESISNIMNPPMPHTQLHNSSNTSNSSKSMPFIARKPQKPRGPIEKSPYKPNLLIQWLKKDQRPIDSNKNNHSWPYLPKELILRIMQFLTIKENASFALVCQYYRKCFNSIWFSYDFFGRFNFNTFTTEKQINKVFEKASRLCHIKKMKSILTGKKVEAFIKKTKLSTTLAKNMQGKGSLFEEFSVEPRTKGVALFLTDREVVDICESSKYSLMFISLVSCQLLTDKSFCIIAKCVSLQNLAICKNNFLKDEHLSEILRNCKNLKSLNISGCLSLTDRILEDISVYSQRIEILEIAELPQLNMSDLYKIRTLKALKKLNISGDKLTNDALKRFFMKDLENLRNIEYLNMDGCCFLDKETIFLLCIVKLPRLKYLNLAHNLNFEEIDIWKLVHCLDSLVELDVETHLFTEKTREQLALNKIFDGQKK